jgi:hypothetical protein
MTGIEATVTTGPSYSTFDRLPAGFGNPDQADLDRLTASLDYLWLYCCKFGAREAGKRPGDELVAEQV